MEVLDAEPETASGEGRWELGRRWIRERVLEAVRESEAKTLGRFGPELGSGGG